MMNAPATPLTPEQEQAQLDAFLATLKDLPVDKLVKLYVRTREAKAAATKAFDAQDAKYKAIMEAVENNLLAAADRDGVDGFKTEFGTTFVATDTKISIADSAVFEAFLDQQDDKYGFFERRVSSRRIAEYMKEHEEQVPPGLNLFRNRVMRVRKAGDK